MFDDRLKKAREASNLTVKQAAAALRLPYTTYNNYEKNTREPSGGLICKMAEFFGVSTDYLLGMSNELSKKNESDIMDKWEKLDKHGKKIVGFILDAEYERCCDSAETITAKVQEDEYKPEIKMITVKSSEYRVSAGTGVLLDEGDCNTEVRVPDSPVARKADFALTISGDSMEPIYHDGDIVLVKRQNFVSMGEIGIFVVDGNGFIKKFGGDRLISLNSEYSDIILDDNSYVRCCGKVIGRA